MKYPYSIHRVNTTKPFLSIFLAILLIISLTANAALEVVTVHQDANLNVTLVRIINQLDAILPLIEQAEREQTQMLPSSRHIQFETFTTRDGVTHPGLRQDVMAMRKALIDVINQTPVELGKITPLALDYSDIPSLSKVKG